MNRQRTPDNREDVVMWLKNMAYCRGRISDIDAEFCLGAADMLTATDPPPHAIAEAERLLAAVCDHARGSLPATLAEEVNQWFRTTGATT